MQTGIQIHILSSEVECADFTTYHYFHILQAALNQHLDKLAEDLTIAKTLCSILRYSELVNMIFILPKSNLSPCKVVTPHC